MVNEFILTVPKQYAQKLTEKFSYYYWTNSGSWFIKEQIKLVLFHEFDLSAIEIILLH